MTNFPKRRPIAMSSSMHLTFTRDSTDLAVSYAPLTIESSNPLFCYLLLLLSIVTGSIVLGHTRQII